MTITNEEYQLALQTVAEREKSLLEEAKVFIDAFTSDLGSRLAEFQALVTSLPLIAGNPSGTRALVENAIAQLTSVVGQVNYIKQSIDGGLIAYNPQPVYSMPTQVA